MRGTESRCQVLVVAALSSRVVAHGLAEVCGIFLDQGSKPVSPVLADGFLSTVPGSPVLYIFVNKDKSFMEGIHYLRHAHTCD